ncbi:hypothetical protein [Streptomyces sp. NPDC005805]|uniref:hypothetical protein n=1 Tax=Streptomyces sp. NPDC005805 TaxID=3157068 RepID=UPI00340A2DF1
MAWDEWEQIKSEVASRRADGMQLNGTGGTGGADGAADLRTYSQGKRGAIGFLEEHIRPGLGRAGGHADESTNAAEREFSGWDTGSGLKDAHEQWAQQVKSMQARLARDQTSLGQAKREFQYVDHGVGGDAKRSSNLLPDPRREA